MEYRSVADLSRLTRDWAAYLPRDIELIVGIPRSGMLVANLLALHLHLPVTDVRGFCEGRVMASGRRHARRLDLSRKRKVLVVDDSISSGNALATAKTRIEAAELPHDICYGAAIASPEAVRAGKIKLFCEVIPMPRIFEWNIMHAPSLSRVCIQLEGVLHQGGGKAASISPSYKVGWIVSDRPDEERRETERWLCDQGIEYDQLVMGCADIPAAYRDLDAEVLIVHEATQAAEIAGRTNKPVFSMNDGSMAYPDDYPRYLHVPIRPPHAGARAARWLATLPLRVLNKIARALLGRPILIGKNPEARYLKHAVRHYQLSEPIHAPRDSRVGRPDSSKGRQYRPPGDSPVGPSSSKPGRD